MQSRIIIDAANKDGRILLVGQFDKSIISTADCTGVNFQTSKNISDAIVAASAENFDITAVIVEDFDDDFVSAIKTLRKINLKSRFLLLAQMWQEPKVAQLINSYFNGSKIADDYYILPVSFTLKKTDVKQTAQASPLQSTIIEQQRQRIDILEKLVMEDELTGAKNRRFVREFLRQITSRAAEESLQVTFLIFDIDNFKQYNDLYGHTVGDSILKQAAVLMQKCCRRQDVVGRIGGDEFAVVFWNLPADRAIAFDSGAKTERRSLESEHPTQVINICERFRKELTKTDLPALGAEGKGTLTISGGLATFPRDGKTVEELFLQADKALLEAKRSGKNRVYLIGSESNNPTA